MNTKETVITVDIYEIYGLQKLKFYFEDLLERVMANKEILQQKGLIEKGELEQCEEPFLKMISKIDILLEKFSNKKKLTAKCTEEELGYYLDDIFLYLSLIQRKKIQGKREKEITFELINLFERFFVFHDFNKKLTLKFLRFSKGNIRKIKKLVKVVPFGLAFSITFLIFMGKLIFGKGNINIITFMEFTGLLIFLHGILLVMLKSSILFFSMYQKGKYEYYYITTGVILLFISQLLRII